MCFEKFFSSVPLLPHDDFFSRLGGGETSSLGPFSLWGFWFVPPRLACVPPAGSRFRGMGIGVWEDRGVTFGIRERIRKGYIVGRLIVGRGGGILEMYTRKEKRRGERYKGGWRIFEGRVMSEIVRGKRVLL